MSANPLVTSLVETLRETGRRIVFAESCTGGLVSAKLVSVPGISEFHCGSAVVYRLDTKTCWLGVSEDVLERHGAVSEIVAKRMATGVRKATPEADVAISVTGDLGPNAPPETDGVVFIGSAMKGENVAERHFLKATAREARRREAVDLVLVRAREAVERLGAHRNKPSKGDSTA